MKYCANCGTALDDAAVFCSGCGAQQAPAAPVDNPTEVLNPVESVPAAPEYVQPAAPEYVQPAAPEYVQPAAPEYVQPAAPEYVQPVAPEYVQPVAPATPVYPSYQPTVAPIQEGPSVKSKILGGIGMGLAIFGFVFALIVFFMGIAAVDSYDDELAIMGISYSIVCLPFSILGTIFCGSARKDGVGGMAVTGKIFGIIGIVLYGLGFLLSCGGL